jgi:hypothetical protein
MWAEPRETKKTGGEAVGEKANSTKTKPGGG